MSSGPDNWRPIDREAKCARAVLLLSVSGVSVASWDPEQHRWAVLLFSTTGERAYYRPADDAIGDNAHVLESQALAWAPVPLHDCYSGDEAETLVVEAPETPPRSGDDMTTSRIMILDDARRVLGAVDADGTSWELSVDGFRNVHEICVRVTFPGQPSMFAIALPEGRGAVGTFRNTLAPVDRGDLVTLSAGDVVLTLP